VVGCDANPECQGKRLRGEAMPIDEIRGGLSFPQKRIIDGFDEAAKGLAAGTISRRRALKLTGTALLGGGLLALFAGVAGAQVSVQQGSAARRPSAIRGVRQPTVAATETASAPRP
jgi:hypothetical protein